MLLSVQLFFSKFLIKISPAADGQALLIMFLKSQTSFKPIPSILQFSVSKTLV